MFLMILFWFDIIMGYSRETETEFEDSFASFCLVQTYYDVLKIFEYQEIYWTNCTFTRETVANYSFCSGSVPLTSYFLILCGDV